MLYKDWIKQGRIKRGFNQKKLAELLNISPSLMCQIEAGTTEASPETMANIKHVFDANEIIVPNNVVVPVLN